LMIYAVVNARTHFGLPHTMCCLFVCVSGHVASSTLLVARCSCHQYTGKNKSVILFLVTRINIAGTRNT
jgi:hypothetical protein